MKTGVEEVIGKVDEGEISDVGDKGLSSRAATEVPGVDPNGNSSGKGASGTNEDTVLDINEGAIVVEDGLSLNRVDAPPPLPQAKTPGKTNTVDSERVRDKKKPKSNVPFGSQLAVQPLGLMRASVQHGSSNHDQPVADPVYCYSLPSSPAAQASLLRKAIEGSGELGFRPT
ncbi:hypothetical protein U1Q18_040477 [Sarracenia purpurea var. burkii]